MSDQIRIFTFKAGLLSRVAHDLRLHVERFTITHEGGRVSAEFEPDSIVVDGVMHGASFDSSTLDADDRAKIRATIRETLLHTRRHPKIRFSGTLEQRGEGGVKVVGELELVGVRRPLSFVATRRGARLVATITLTPSEFGIPPYKALAGAIRLEDRVVVELDLDSVSPAA